MRKILITLGILIAFGVGVMASWIFWGRQISLFIDRFGTIEVASTKISSLTYEGNGTAGWFIANNDVHLILDDIIPKITLSIGSTKDNQVAVASGGKVFAFGPSLSASENGGDNLATAPQAGDAAFLVTRHSALSWPTPFDINFMTGHSPSWKRRIYYELRWTKSTGASLDMLWRYEQLFYGKQFAPDNGWDNGFGTRPGSTGLLRVEIHP
jgi:hypothetical protein